jgi:hypothetical protein
LFDLLRLRSTLAEAAERLGVEGEEGWRAAARVRVALGHPASAHVADGSPSWLRLGSTTESSRY